MRRDARVVVLRVADEQRARGGRLFVGSGLVLGQRLRLPAALRRREVAQHRDLRARHAVGDEDPLPEGPVGAPRLERLLDQAAPQIGEPFVERPALTAAGQIGGAARQRVPILVGDHIERRPHRQKDLAVAIAVDVTSAGQIEALTADGNLVFELFSAQERWAHVVKRSAEGVAVLDPDGRIVDSNASFFELMRFRSAHGVILSEEALRGRPLFFSELGYPALASAAARPWDDRTDAAVDLELQQDLYESFCEAMGGAGAGLIKGFYAWNWFGFGGPTDRGYTPRGKPAASSLRACLRGFR